MQASDQWLLRRFQSQLLLPLSCQPHRLKVKRVTISPQVKNMKPCNLCGALACNIISLCSGHKFWTFCAALQLHSATCYNCTNQHPDHSVCSANSAASRLQCGHGTALDFIFYWPRQAESCYHFTSFLFCDIQMVVIGN